MFDSLAGKEFVVIDDLRFWEELVKITQVKGVIYKVQSSPTIRKARGWVPNKQIDEDLSEAELDLAPYTFYKLTGGGGIFNNELDSDAKLRSQIYNILTKHF